MARRVGVKRYSVWQDLRKRIPDLEDQALNALALFAVVMRDYNTTFLNTKEDKWIMLSIRDGQIAHIERVDR